MNIAIISDSHDNVPNIEKFLAWAAENKIEMIVHCGDVAAPGVIKQIFAEQFSGPIHLVHGNVLDRELLAKVCDQYKNITLHGDVGKIILPPPCEGGGEGEVTESAPASSISSKKSSFLNIAFCHFPEQARELAETGKHNLVFYGHTHKPWIEKLANGCQLINPGTLGGLFQKPTFAVYDSDNNNLELKLLEEL